MNIVLRRQNLEGLGTQSLALGFRASTVQIFPASLAAGPVSVTLSTRPSALIVYMPSIALDAGGALHLSTLSSSAQIFAPSVTPAALAVSLGTLASTAQLYTPSVGLLVQNVSLPIIASSAQVFAPNAALQAPQTLTLAFVASTAQIHTPAIGAAARTLSLAVIPPGTTLYPPLLGLATSLVHLPTCASTTILFAPAVGIQRLALATIPAGSQIFPLRAKTAFLTSSLHLYQMTPMSRTYKVTK